MSSNNPLKNITYNYLLLQKQHNYIIHKLATEYPDIPIREKINKYTQEFTEKEMNEHKNKSGGRKNKKTKHNKKRRRKRKTKKHTK